jgi:NAD-dependent dihydropyrimidine dehydrogenase PreA subunit
MGSPDVSDRSIAVIREIVTIDEELCDGCGLCVPSCQEGAIRLVDGKARLVSDRLCDGLGVCLGHCPQGAIKIEHREAEVFDEQAVAAHLAADESGPDEDSPCACPSSRLAALPAAESQQQNGCPGARLTQFSGRDGVSGAAPLTDRHAAPGQPSALTHWPVQLRLLPPNAPILKGARLLVAADCVPVAYADFHSQLLRDHAVVIACPKLDDTSGYVEKLEAMIRHNHLREITVTHMEVPCCHGILQAVLEAHRRANSDVPVNDVVIGTRGKLNSRSLVAGHAQCDNAGGS